MPKLIDDEFTDLKVSRQVRYQRRKLRDRCCPKCGGPQAVGQLCGQCNAAHQEIIQKRGAALYAAFLNFNARDYVIVGDKRAIQLRNPIVRVDAKNSTGWSVRLHYVSGRPQVQRFFSDAKHGGRWMARYRATCFCLLEIRKLQSRGIVTAATSVSSEEK